MKVALYQPWIFKRGGAERVFLELFKRSSHKFTLFTHYFDQSKTFEEFSKYDVRSLSNMTINGTLSQGMRFAKEILRTKIKLDEFDVFVISAGALGGLIALRNHDIPVMCYCQSLDIFDDQAWKNFRQRHYDNTLSRGMLSLIRSVYHQLEKKAWSYMNLVSANSNYIKNLIQKAGLANEVVVINPGVDATIYKPTWNYEKYFFHPGRIDPPKRQHIAIEAFKLFSKKNNGFKLVIAGKVLESTLWYYDELKELSKNDSNIVIIPDDKDFLQLYQNAYAVIVPSIGEAWGLVVLEGMACGKPVIITDQGGMRESVLDGKTGFILPDDPRQFSEKMEILANDPQLNREIGLNAYRRALPYEWKEFARKFDTYVEVTSTLASNKCMKTVPQTLMRE